MSADWFRGVAPASATVDCGADTHTLEWREGELLLSDHGDDLEAERALAALGCERCRCFELLSAWQRHASDPRVLLLGPRDRHVSNGPRPRRAPRRRNRLSTVQTGGPAQAGSGQGWWSYPQQPPEDPLESLLRLEGAIPFRLVATTSAALADRAEDPALAPALRAALYGRLTASLSRWRSAEVALALDMTGGAPRLEPRDDRSDVHGFSARLPFSWLTEVWGRELDVLGDQFTLSAERDPTGGWSLTSVDHDMNVNTRTLKS